MTTEAPRSSHDVRRRADRRRERGSVLMLMPAAVLVIVVLGAIAVDHAVVFGVQRELISDAQDAANDAAAYGLDPGALRSGRFDYDASRVDRSIHRSLAAHGSKASVEWHVADGRIVVRLRRDAPRVFAGALPGQDGAVTVDATADAVLRRR